MCTLPVIFFSYQQGIIKIIKYWGTRTEQNFMVLTAIQGLFYNSQPPTIHTGGEINIIDYAKESKRTRAMLLNLFGSKVRHEMLSNRMYTNPLQMINDSLMQDRNLVS